MWFYTLEVDPWMIGLAKGVAVALTWALAVLVAKRLVAPTLKRLSARTRSGIDDAVAHALTKLRVVRVIPLAMWAAVPPDVFTDTSAST